jgi:hypothetical protein
VHIIFSAHTDFRLDTSFVFKIVDFERLLESDFDSANMQVEVAEWRSSSSQVVSEVHI